MKNILKHISRAAAACTLAFTLSCHSDYLDTVPTSSVSSISAVQTADNLMNVINGMHRDMYVRQNSSQGQTGEGAMMIMRDALGEDLVFPSTGNGWFISTVRWQDQGNENGSNDFFPWQFYYALIRNANTVIINGANATGDANLRNKAIAEAYTYRAFCYFNLVQLFGKRYVAGAQNSQLGVPLVLDLEILSRPRNSVEEVYTQINSDLDNAITMFASTTGGRAAKSHFDVNVARGLKARVALTQGKWQLANDMAALARNGFALMSNAEYQAGFNSLANGEWMWGSAIIADQQDYFGNFGAYMSRNYNSTNIRQAPKAVNKLLYAKFPTTDVRTKVIDPTGAHTALALPSTYSKFPYTSQKFLSVSVADSRTDVPYMRAAEMYLIQAETLARLGQETASRTIFNALQLNRNPSYVASTNTGASYIQEIMDSRRLELWGEGFRFYDLKRLALPLDRTNSNHSAVVDNNILTVAADDKRWEYLIPKSEIDASNGVVVQNPK